MRSVARQWPLASGIRFVMTSTFVRAVAPATITRDAASFFASSTSLSRSSTPLSEPLQHAITAPSPVVPSSPAKVQTRDLPGGARTGAFPLPGPLAAVAVLARSGSAYESTANFGVSKLLEYLAFQATKHRTTFRITREIEKFRFVPSSKVGREYASFTLECTKLHIPEALEILLDSVLNPKFNSWEVKDLLPHVQDEVQKAVSTPEILLMDVLHRVAFDGALGYAVVPDVSDVAKLSADTVKDYVTQYHVPANFVLAGAGVEAQQLQSLAGPLLDSSSPPAKYISSYIGGSLSAVAPSDLTYAAVAFEAKGGLSDPKGAAAASVLAALFDVERTAIPYSTKHVDVVKSLKPIASLYSTTGLLGLLVSSDPSSISAAVDVIFKKLEEAAKGVREPAIKLAKATALSKYYNVLQTTSGVVDELGRQLLLTGKFSPAEHVSAIQSVTAADLTNLVKSSLKTPLSIATYGKLSNLPRIDGITKRFA